MKVYILQLGNTDRFCGLLEQSAMQCNVIVIVIVIEGSYAREEAEPAFLRSRENDLEEG